MFCFAYLFHLYYTNSESEQNYTIYIFKIVGQRKSGPPQPVGEGGGGCERTRRIPLPYGPELGFVTSLKVYLLEFRNRIFVCII